MQSLKVLALIVGSMAWYHEIKMPFFNTPSTGIVKEKNHLKVEKLQQEESIKIAAIALATVDGMVDANYQRALRLTEIAEENHPDIILLPEAFAAGYAGNDLSSYAETFQTSKYLQEFRHRSLQYNCMIVMGYLEKDPDGVRNAVVIFDRGETVGIHYKSSLWADNKRPYRDERRLLVPGKGMEVFKTRFGRMGLLTCYENMMGENWDSLKGKVDFVISPYNCEGDPSRHNISGSRNINVPSAWADRVGTVYCGTGCYTSNPGTAGMVNKDGKVLLKSPDGIEKVVTGIIKVHPL
jgi:predicted amidohydrolase